MSAAGNNKHGVVDICHPFILSFVGYQLFALQVYILPFCLVCLLINAVLIIGPLMERQCQCCVNGCLLRLLKVVHDAVLSDNMVMQSCHNASRDQCWISMPGILIMHMVPSMVIYPLLLAIYSLFLDGIDQIVIWTLTFARFNSSCDILVVLQSYVDRFL